MRLMRRSHFAIYLLLSVLTSALFRRAPSSSISSNLSSIPYTPSSESTLHLPALSPPRLAAKRHTTFPSSLCIGCQMGSSLHLTFASAKVLLFSDMCKRNEFFYTKKETPSGHLLFVHIIICCCPQLFHFIQVNAHIPISHAHIDYGQIQNMVVFYTSPCSTMAFATFIKPAMLAPLT